MSATEFARKFTTFRERACVPEGVIEITAHDRTIGGFLSAELSHYHDMIRREREVIRVSEMDDETMVLIMNSEYGKVS